MTDEQRNSQILPEALASITPFERRLWGWSLARNLRRPRTRLSLRIPRYGVEAATRMIVAELWLLPAFLSFVAVPILQSGSHDVVLNSVGAALLTIAILSVLVSFVRIATAARSIRRYRAAMRSAGSANLAVAKTVEPRELTDDERGILARILSEAHFDGSVELLGQVASARITGGLPMFVDLAVDHSMRPATIGHAPVPVRALVEGAKGDIQGEILVWVTDGYLSGLEFAWVTYDMPEAFPSPERLRIEPE